MHLGNWQLDTVHGGFFWLDGGVMFGPVPKSLWKSVAPPDDENRVLVACHCVLARDGTHTVLIDTGYGGKFSPLEQKFYGLEPGEPLLAGLAELDVPPDQIDTIVFSHLHFDHIGGATRLNGQRRPVPVFPRARYVVGRAEWEDATGGAAELKTAYPIDEILALYETERVMVVDDGQTVLPGLRVEVTGGHTRGHMALVFESGGQTAAYLGDICPSQAHLRRMWHLAYDVYPLDTRRRKPELLGRAADQGWWILWDHDPRSAVSRVARDARREFIPIDSRPQL